MVGRDVDRVRLKSVSDEDFPSCVDSVVWILCEECGYKHYVPIMCGRRTCPQCAFRRFLEMKKKYRRLKNPRNAKFLTLTLKRSWDLEDLIERPIGCFKKLRRRKIFRNVRSGFYSIEVKPPTSEGWFVHIHAIINSPFISKGKISEDWKDLTGDSYVVKITTAKFRKNIVYYVLDNTPDKIKIKETWEDVPEWRKEKFEKVAKNRRLIQPFGNFFGIVFENPEPFKCPKCGCTERIFLEIEYIEKEEWQKKKH